MARKVEKWQSNEKKKLQKQYLCRSIRHILYKWEKCSCCLSLFAHYFLCVAVLFRAIWHLFLVLVMHDTHAQQFSICKLQNGTVYDSLGFQFCKHILCLSGISIDEYLIPINHVARHILPQASNIFRPVFDHFRWRTVLMKLNTNRI